MPFVLPERIVCLMTRRVDVYVVLVTVCAVAASAHAAEPFNGYEALSNWDALPLDKTHLTAYLASTYDPNFGNDDWNRYESPGNHQLLNTYPDDNNIETVVMTLQGPGVITRFQMPHACANIGAGNVFPVKITVDGALMIDTDTNTLLEGAYDATNTDLFKGPLVTTLVGGQVSYEPIVFQNSLVIETRNYCDPTMWWAQRHHYYQYNYTQLPADTQVTPYDGTLGGARAAARSAAVDMRNNVGANPAGPSTTSTVVDTPAHVIGGGSTLQLKSIAGSGVIRRLNVKMTGAADAHLDGLRLRVRYDGNSANAVDVPVSQFFGAGHNRAAYQSLPLGTTGDDGFYCYWPMPYRQGAVVELYNETGGNISIDSAVVEYEPTDVPADAGYFHAVYSTDNNVSLAGHPHDYHELLNVAGQGHYVGNLLHLWRNGTSRSIIEGDDIVLVDGGEGGGGHTLYGNGLEDAYNGGYYYNHVLEQIDDGDLPDRPSGTLPLSGLLNMEDEDSGHTHVRTDQYRWMISDAVPFTDGIQVLNERHYGAGSVFGSTAFYYATGPVPAAWDNINGRWSSKTNWTPDATPSAAGHTAARVDRAGRACRVATAGQSAMSLTVVNGLVNVLVGGELTIDEDIALAGGEFRLSGGTAAVGGALRVDAGATVRVSGMASLTVAGAVTLGDGSTFASDAVGAAAGMIASGSVATLGANTSLDIVVSGGGNEFSGGTYTLIDADGGMDGAFAHVTDLGAYVSVNGDGLTYDEVAGTVTLTLDKNLNPADGNLDGATDVSDRIIWSSNNFTFGTTFQTGDYNNDGATDVSDRIIWNSHNFTFASASPGPGGSPTVPIPEPATLALLSLGGMFVGLRRRSRKA